MKQHNPRKNESALKACVVLPTYNEAENIEPIIRAIFDTQPNIKTHQLYVLVVDDNSTDGTQEIVKKQMKQFPHLNLDTGNKIGLGDAYKRGIAFVTQELKADLLLFMDADGQHDPKLIPSFINNINQGFDLVIGSRLVPGGDSPGFSYWRKFISVLGNFLVRNIGGARNIKDCTSGFKCIKLDLLHKCDLNHLSTKGYSFNSLLVCELIKNGANPIEIPIIFSDRVKGKSKLSLNDQIEFLFNIMIIIFHNSRDFIRYCCVGLVGAAVNTGIYVLLNRYYQINLQVASLMAVETAILTNFLLNNYWTFKQRAKKLSLFQRLINFHIAAGISGVFFYYLFFLFLVQVIGLNDLLSIPFAIAAGTISNFTINSLWTWRK